MTTNIATMARRVTIHEARRAFATGARVLVSEDGEPFVYVRPNSTTHHQTTTTWAALAAEVAMWRNRYPRQRYYIVESNESNEVTA